MNQTKEPQPHSEIERNSPPSIPRWVKVFGIIIFILILLFVALQFIGGGHNPGRHLPSGDPPSVEHNEH